MVKIYALSLFCLSFLVPSHDFLVWAEEGEGAVTSSEETYQGPSRKDLKERFPHLMTFLEKADLSGALPNDPGLKELLGGTRAIRPSPEIWKQFLTAALADKLTNLRAFALFGLEAKKRQLSIWTTGPDYHQALQSNRVKVGLSLPADNVIVAVWKVTPPNAAADHLMDVTMYFSKPYVSEFEPELIPAALKVGDADPVEFALMGKKQVGYPMRAELFWDQKKLGFRKVKGVSGRKTGFAGFLQKLLFFLPDAVDSMVIEDKEGRMVTEAIVNTVIDDFEKNEKYRMSQLSEQLHASAEAPSKSNRDMAAPELQEIQVMDLDVEDQVVLDSVE